jgi:radical SAM protein with 4Fe4S-binding SPASM domain
MNLSNPIFFSVQLGNNGVYSKFLEVHVKESEDLSRKAATDTLRHIENYIDKNHSLIGISLYGDHFQNYDLNALFQKCRKRDIKISIDISCNESNTNFIIKNIDYIDVIRISLFSLNAMKHNKMFVDNELEYVMNFIDNIQAFQVGKVMIIPILEENWEELAQISEYAEKKNYKINPLPIPQYCDCSDEILSYKSFNQFSKRLAALQNCLGDKVYLDIPIAYRYFQKNSICPAMRLSFDVTFEGKIRPCKFTNINLGNIEDINIHWAKNKEIWGKAHKCIECSDFGQCGGGCLGNKKSLFETDFYCTKNRREVGYV